jgi:hypothetical protein
MEHWSHKLGVKMGDESKVEINVTATLAGLTLDNFVARGLRDFAANAVKTVRDGDKTAEEFAAGFQDLVEKYSRGETAKREGGGAAKVDTVETATIKNLAFVLKTWQDAGKIASAKVPLINGDNPPKTEKGHINYNAWAKQQRDGGHPWYAAAKKETEKEIAAREAKAQKSYE